MPRACDKQPTSTLVRQSTALGWLIYSIGKFLPSPISVHRRLSCGHTVPNRFAMTADECSGNVSKPIVRCGRRVPYTAEDGSRVMAPCTRPAGHLHKHDPLYYKKAVPVKDLSNENEGFSVPTNLTLMCRTFCPDCQVDTLHDHELIYKLSGSPGHVDAYRRRKSRRKKVEFHDRAVTHRFTCFHCGAQHGTAFPCSWSEDQDERAQAYFIDGSHPSKKAPDNPHQDPSRA